MNAYFAVGKASTHSSYIPKIGEVVLYERDKELQIWDTRIGDGKTPVKNLPSLANYDIYTRVSILEEKLNNLQQRINNG